MSHKMYYDKASRTMRLHSSLKDLREIREIFERDVISEEEEPVLKRLAYKFHDYCIRGYVREPHVFKGIKLDFTKGITTIGEPMDELKAFNAQIKARCIPLNDNTYSITIMLVNTDEVSINIPEKCLYQAKLGISNKSNQANKFRFVEKNAFNRFNGLDEEELALAMLYRDKKIYATGLGTATRWDIDKDGIGEIWNDFLPTNEIPSMQFSLNANELLTDQELSMKYLSDLDDTDKKTKLKSLENLVVLYKQWVDQLEEKQKALDISFATAATKNISLCKKAYTRMQQGVKALKNNDMAFLAFQLANRAMFMQRVHLRMQAELSNKDRYDGDEKLEERLEAMDYYAETDNNCYWRPFQLAFILLRSEEHTSELQSPR